jgi:hypothetical protein
VKKGWAAARGDKKIGLAMRHDKDVDMLKSSLEEPADLDEWERDAFPDMLESLRRGPMRTLSEVQRDKVERALERIGRPVYENLVSSGKVKADPSAPKHPFELMPRPLRPPTRAPAKRDVEIDEDLGI